MTDENILKSSRILIVDDIALNRTLLKTIYKRHGFYLFKEAENGLEALKIIAEWKPDMVLLDIMMPEMDGTEVCRRVVDKKEYGNPVIMVQTALTDREHKVKLFECGATDYVTKPVDMSELIARSKAHLEKRYLNQEIADYSSRVKAELKEAAHLQSLILPSIEQLDALQEKYGVTLAGHYQPSMEMGGDFWGVKPISDSLFSMYVVDFSGHGVHASLNTFRIHTLLNDEQLPLNKPEELLNILNNKLCALLPKGHFATMMYCVVDVQNKEITIAAGGGPSPIYKSNTGTISLPLKGFPLGAIEGAAFDAHTYPFTAAHTIMLYSDVLVEMASPETERLLENDDLCRLLQKAKGDEVDGQISEVLTHFNEHIQHNDLADDLTIVICNAPND